MLGVIVFAHGSRDPLWHLPVEAVATAIRQRNADVPVTCAYLELSTPDLPTAAVHLMAQGCTHVRVLPLFFGMGKHAREDLPQLMQELQNSYPNIRFERLPAAGEDPRLAALLAHIVLDTPE